jgi:hypothetical protein
MRIALDTNRYRDLCDGEEGVVQLLEEARSVHIPLIVIAELRAGDVRNRLMPGQSAMHHRT